MEKMICSNTEAEKNNGINKKLTRQQFDDQVSDAEYKKQDIESNFFFISNNIDVTKYGIKFSLEDCIASINNENFWSMVVAQKNMTIRQVFEEFPDEIANVYACGGFDSEIRLCIEKQIKKYVRKIQ